MCMPKGIFGMSIEILDVEKSYRSGHLKKLKKYHK